MMYSSIYSFRLMKNLKRDATKEGMASLRIDAASVLNTQRKPHSKFFLRF